MKGFELIVSVIFMEAAYQQGLIESGFEDSAIYREAFLAFFMENLVAGFLRDIDNQVDNGLLDEAEGVAFKNQLGDFIADSIKKEKAKKLQTPTKTKKWTNTKDSESLPKVLKDETEGRKLPPSSLFSSNDYIN